MTFKMEKQFSSPIIVCIISFVIGASCEQYVPGTPGGPWTDTEVAIVRQKVIQMLNQTNYLERPRGHAPLFHKGNLLLTAYHGCTKGNYFHCLFHVVSFLDENESYEYPLLLI